MHIEVEFDGDSVCVRARCDCDRIQSIRVPFEGHNLPPRNQGEVGRVFTDGPVRNFDDAKRADHDRYARLFHHMLSNGVYLPPSGYELWTLSAVLTDDHVETILTAAATFTG